MTFYWHKKQGMPKMKSTVTLARAAQYNSVLYDNFLNSWPCFLHSPSKWDKIGNQKELSGLILQ